jgi:arylformamidase
MRPDEISRRRLLTGLSITALAAGAAPPARAQSKVFLDYDQAALDRAYDQRHWAPNMQQVLRRYAINSEAVRARLGAPRTISYGSSTVETLDIYVTPRPNAPVMVFIHGGAWRTGNAKDYAYPADAFVRAGAHYVVPDFANAMEVGLDGMVAQVRRAVAWVYRNAASFGGNPNRVYVSGHSSGGHLAGNVLVTDWTKDFMLPADVVKGGVCVSGMFDLRGPRLSARSSYVKFDDHIEHEYSSQRHLARLACPVIVAYGDQESPEFQRQSREFAEALRRAGRLHALIVAQGYNHFEVPEMLGNPYSPLGRATLELMTLG